MPETVVRAEGLSKKYRIYHEPPGLTSLRESIATHTSNAFKSVVRGLVDQKPSSERSPYEDLWALRDVSFEIQAGSRVGIIGGNGAGKSTLLKILSRIVEPTQGRVTIHGRVSSLLEVGTGFHPELSGAENIYLNGAILGMSRAEIREKFDQVVAFSELEKFLDTPIKRYSSGMQMRLAFAVAAHLDPDILIIDEVLAVGDFRFQEKCLHKLDEIGQQGRTIIFVSHDIGKVISLCDRALLMEKGRLTMIGDTESCVSHYMGSHRRHATVWEGVAGNALFTCFHASVRGTNTGVRSYFTQDEDLRVAISYEVHRKSESYEIRFSIWNELGVCVASRTLSRSDPVYALAIHEGPRSLTLSFSAATLHEGRYQLLIQVSVNGSKLIDREIALQVTIYAGSQGLHSRDEQCVVLGDGWQTDGLAMATRPLVSSSPETVRI